MFIYTKAELTLNTEQIIYMPILFYIDSYDHRAGVRAKLAADDNWIAQYFGKILPWFQMQENMTLSPLPNFETVIHPKDKGILFHLFYSNDKFSSTISRRCERQKRDDTK